MTWKGKTLIAVIAVLFTAAVVWAGTFTSYDDDTTLEDTDEFLIYDSGEGSGDQLSNITWLNLRGQIWADMAAGDLPNDGVLPADLDQDGNYTSLTGAWATTGLLSGGVVTKVATTDYTIGTTNAAEKYGGIIYVTGAATITYPAVGAGMHFTIITVGAVAVHGDPNASDKQCLDGTWLDDGDKASNTSTTGDVLVVTYYSTDGWYTASGSPDGDHWTDGS